MGAAYFDGISAALRAEGIAWPVIVIDRARLDENIRQLMMGMPEGMAFRLVAKSLPSVPLLRHVMTQAGTDRLMTFNTRMLAQLSEAFPEASQLLGKPVPVAAARAYLKAVPVEAARHVQWLLDTGERLAEYGALAEEIGCDLAISLELDVGLHRGGFVPGAELQAALEMIRDHPRLSLAGFVGYEPHVPSLPEAGGWRERALEGAWESYRAALSQAADVFGADHVEAMTRNAGGSPTFRLYRDTSVANEIAAGSGLVKPSGFDLPLLDALEPAAFIATPVLKVQKTLYPGTEYSGREAKPLPAERELTVFIHGGRWMADVVYPEGLSEEGAPVRSTNQDWLLGPADIDLKPDDFVFLRPRQSEAVLLQFGDLAVYEEGKITQMWEVLPVSA